MGDIFNTLLVTPIINVLVAIYQVLFFLHIPYALGFSIIILTALIRLLLYPLTTAQLKASKKMQELAPHLAHVKEKHKGDNTRIQQETMRLYKEHGVNPAAGCLPVLVQIPIIWSLYGVLQKIVTLTGSAIVTDINKIVYPLPALKLHSPWDQHFFGIALGQSPSQLLHSIGPAIILVSILTGVFQLIQSKMMFKSAPKTTGKKDEDFSSLMQTQSTYIFPVMIGFFSFSLPIGLSLYWNTFTIFGILQQYRVQGLGGLTDWIDKLYGKKR